MYAFMSAFDVPLRVVNRAIRSVEALNFDRFLVANYTSHQLLVATAEVVFCRTDYGPGSKLLCPLKYMTVKEKASSYVTLVDADVVYLPYVRVAVESHVSFSTAVSFWGYQVGPYQMLQGADAFTMHLSHLGRVYHWYSFVVTKFPFLKWHDDVWISFYLDTQNVTRNVIPRLGSWKRGAYAELCTPPLCNGLYYRRGETSRLAINRAVQDHFLPFYAQLT